MDFDTGYQDSGVSKLRKAQSLARLFGIGIDHGDMHGGNIRYNSADSPVIIDFSRARPLDKGLTGLSKRDRNVKAGLRAAGDKDISKIYKGIADELGSEAFGSQDPQDIATYRDFIDQAEEVLERSEPSADSKNILNSAPDISRTPPELKSTRTPDVTPPKIKGSPLAGALSVGFVDLIPSRESIRMAASGDYTSALKNHGIDLAKGAVVAGGLAAMTPAAPVIGTLAAAAAPGLVTLAAGEAADEVVTQATGEGIIPKLRQTIGTEPRTGIASPGGSIEETNKREMDRVFNPPEIKPMTQPPKRKPLSSSPLPALGIV